MKSLLILCLFLASSQADLADPKYDVADQTDVVVQNGMTGPEAIKSATGNEDPINVTRSRMDIIKGHLDEAMKVCCQIPDSAKNSSSIEEVNQRPDIKHMVKESQMAHCNSTQLMGKCGNFKTQLIKDPKAATCMGLIEEKVTQLAGILFPFAHVTSHTPTSGWRLMCGSCGDDVKGKVNPMKTETEKAYKLIKGIYSDIEHMEKKEVCKDVKSSVN